MHSRVEIVASRAPDGSTALTRMRAGGMFAVRQTSTGTVHLVGTAAGPLGGDLLQIRLTVEPGATLHVYSVAATIALPSRDGACSRIELEASVADGGHLLVALEPLVVCRGADVASHTGVDLAGSADARIVEQVVLGRHGEDGGVWSGRTVVDRDDHPVLRSSLTPAADIRAIVTSVDLATSGAWTTATFGDAVACRLATGDLAVTSTGRDLATALRDHHGATGRARVEPIELPAP